MTHRSRTLARAAAYFDRELGALVAHETESQNPDKAATLPRGFADHGGNILGYRGNTFECAARVIT